MTHAKLNLAQAVLMVAAMLSTGPVFVQIDLSGWWARRGQTDNSYAREQVDLLGVPVNEDGRVKALSYNIASLSATERQCQMYTPFYAFTGPFPLQISIEQDPVTQRLLAWKIEGWIDRDVTRIWMDGRPHPSKHAPHTHGGFTTGTWEGDALTAVTTHFKLGDIKRHRVFSSDQAKLTYRFNEDKQTGPVAVAAADRANVLRGKSFLGAPLVVEDRAIGVLAVATSKPNAFEAEHERMLSNVASQVAAAIENGRVFEASVQRAEELGAKVQSLALLNRLAAQLTGLLDSGRVLTVAAQELAAALASDRASVVALGEANVLATYAGNTTTRSLPSLDGGWLVEQLQARMQPISLDETSEALTSPAYTAWLGDGLKGALVLPLTAGERLVGIASVGTVAPRTFSPEEIAFATQVAAHIAGPLHNALEYEAAALRGHTMGERAQRLSLLTRAASDMNRSLVSEQVMEIGLKELGTATQSDVVYGALLADGERKGSVYSGGAVAEATVPAEGDAHVEQLRESLSPIVITDPAKRAAWLGEGVAAAIAFPLAAHGKLIGLAAIASRAAREWPASEQELAAALTSEMAVALHNARLHERTLKRLVELGAIAQSTRAVSGSVELSKLYETVRTQVGSLVGAKTMSLALYDETRNEVSFPVMVKDGRAVEAKPDAPNPVLWRIIQTQQALRWSRYADAPVQELGGAHGGNGKGNGAKGANGSSGGYGKSYIGVPLVAGRKTIGVLSVADNEHDDAFDAEHERVLLTLASQVASALDSARLYESAQRKAQVLEGRLQMLAAVNRAELEMSRTLESDRVLEIGLEALRQLPAVDGAVVVLYDNGQPLLYRSGAVADGAVGPGEHDALVEYVRQNRAPLAIGDLDDDSLAKPVSRAWLGIETTSALVLPLMASGVWLGLAAVSTEEHRAFSVDETDWASALAGQMANALHHARQYEAAERRLTEAVTVNGALRAIQRASDLPQLWEALHSQVIALTGVNTLALQLYDETTGEVAVPLLVQKGRVIKAEPQIPGGTTRHVIVTQRPLLLNGNLRESAAAAGITLHEGADGDVITGNSLLAVPLMSGEQVAGVLALASDTANTLNHKHITVLTALAGPFAAALENARTLARTRGELVREQALIEQTRVAAQTASNEIAHLRAEQAALSEQKHRVEAELEEAQTELSRLRQLEPDLAEAESHIDSLRRIMEEITTGEESTTISRALQAVGEAVNAEAGALYLPEAVGSQMRRAEAFGPQTAAEHMQLILAADEGLAGWVIASQSGLRLSNLATDERWRSGPVTTDRRYQAALAAPLLAMGRVEGLLVLLNPAERAFSALQERLIELAARQLALAVRNGGAPEVPPAPVGLVTPTEATSAGTEAALAPVPTVAATMDSAAESDDASTRTMAAAVPAARDNSGDATLVVPRRAPLASDTALKDISPSEMHVVEDVEYSRPQAGINPILLVGLVVALIVGAFLITFLITSGSFASLLGGTQQPTQIVIVTNAPTSTTAIEVVATAVPTLEPTATVAPSTTPTDTAVPTETLTATTVPTETATVGPTLPPGVIALGTIQVIEGTSARLRASPNGAVVGSVPDDTAVQVLQGQEFVDGISWIQIRLPSGAVGWIAESLVEIANSP